MRKKEFFLLVLFALGIISALLFLRFYSLNEFHFRDKLAKYSFFGYTLAASSSNVDLNVDVHGVPGPSPSASGSVSPTGPTPSGSYSYSPSPSGSLSPGPSVSGSFGPSYSPSGSGSPFPPDIPGLGGLLLFSNKVGLYNLILSLLLLLGPTLASILTAILDPFASVPGYLYYLWLLLLQALGIKKKGKEWGVVYDFVSKQPVSLAIVRIIDTTTNQIKDTSITTKSGVFAFLTEEGSYTLKVFKSGYRFPVPELAIGNNSPWIPGKADGHYENIYTGGFVAIKERDQGQINCNIPLEFTGESTYAKWFSEDNTFFA
ncbi:MAG: carboxypeptidase-like regulatory domain-containing protein, partial [Candidatus Berkelbacteria bacterium]|nr:carboxypeptidase-like regulatory domain-containing protein [Candidatus Berkelbacteria bacterium]